MIPDLHAMSENVVVEFGGAASQNIVDRYVAGETVHYDEPERCGRDVTGWCQRFWWTLA